MNVFFTVFLIILLLIFIIVSSSLFAVSAAQMTVGDDPKQQQAYTVLTYGASIGLILAAILVVGGGLFVFYGEIELGTTKIGRAITTLFFITCVVIFFTIGIVAMIAAIDIQMGSDFTANQQYWKYCAWIAGISIGIVLSVILFYIVKYVKKKEDAKKQDELRQNADLAKAKAASGS